MEALQLKIENLQWEMSRLDKENRRLKAQNPEGSKEIDLEAELDQARDDVAKLTRQVKACEERLAEAAEESKTLRQETQELQEGHQCLSVELCEAKHRVKSGRVINEELSSKLATSEGSLSKVSKALASAEARLEELRVQQERLIADMWSEATLDRYKVIETEQQKWEAKESRLVDQLNRARRDCESFDVRDRVITLSAQLSESDKQLSDAKVLISELENTKSSQQQLIEELKAEIVLLQTRLKGVPTIGSTSEIPDPTTSTSSSSAPLGTESPVLTGITTPISTLGTTFLTPSTVTMLPSVSAMTTPLIPPLETLTSGVFSMATPPRGTMPSTVTVSSMTSPPMLAGTGESMPESSMSTPPVPCRTATTHPMGMSEGGVSTPGRSSRSFTAGKTSSCVPFPVVPAYSSQHGLIASSASLLSSLPEIPRFTGSEHSDGETFQDWLEQFESIAVLGRWDNHCKLVNFTTMLRGAAYYFYRSCTPEQRSDYSLLAEELTAVQSRLFHDRRQGQKKTADEFAQDLKKLFARAYSDVSRGGPEAERLGQSLLANQFIAGLRPDLKSKIVGTERNLERLLLKARFEEAKRKELATVKTTPFQPKPTDSRIPGNHSRPPLNSGMKMPQSQGQSSNTSNRRNCYNCGMAGHLARDCQYPKYSRKDKEAAGKKDPVVSNMRSGETTLQEKITELRKALHEAEIEMAADEAAKVLHHVTSEGDHLGTTLGPTVLANIEVNRVEALQ